MDGMGWDGVRWIATSQRTNDRVIRRVIYTLLTPNYECAWPKCIRSGHFVDRDFAAMARPA